MKNTNPRTGGWGVDKDKSKFFFLSNDITVFNLILEVQFLEAFMHKWQKLGSRSGRY